MPDSTLEDAIESIRKARGFKRVVPDTSDKEWGEFPDVEPADDDSEAPHLGDGLRLKKGTWTMNELEPWED